MDLAFQGYAWVFQNISRDKNILDNRSWARKIHLGICQSQKNSNLSKVNLEWNRELKNIKFEHTVFYTIINVFEIYGGESYEKIPPPVNNKICISQT